jgi:thiamine biosynthesis lipoprotein
MRRISTLFLLVTLAACSRPPLQVYKFDRPLMHTRWDFSVSARSLESAQAAFEEAATEVERLDKSLAMWRTDSELYAFNSRAGQGPQKVSADLDRVLSLGLKISGLSQGASDCTVGPLVQLWYDKLKKKELPSEAELKLAMRAVDYKGVKREGERLWSSPAGCRVDLGSLAKGYAQDRAALLLRARGLKSFLMNAGGQVYAAGRKPDGSKWSVGVLHPRDSGRIAAVVALEEQGMSTSGDYEQSVILRGRRYHHILDPRTGRPTENGMASATVILSLKGAQEPGAASWCDALDTAAMVLGREKGMEMLKQAGASAILIHEGKDGKLDALLSDDLKDKLKMALN